MVLFALQHTDPQRIAVQLADFLVLFRVVLGELGEKVNRLAHKDTLQLR